MQLKTASLIICLHVFTACIISCSQKMPAYDAEDGLQSFSQVQFAGDIKVLSSDEFQGRMPFTPGEQKTLDYLEKRFKELGLEPGNGDSYMQKVPMVELTATPEATMRLSKGNSRATLAGFDNYVIWTHRPVEKIVLDNDELVFAGFGIVAPEYNWDDYKDLDVKGKIVLVLVNDPGFASKDSLLFKGATMTYYGRWPYKFEEAARHGAKGCLVIHNTEAAGYAFSNPQNNWKASRLLPDPRGKKQNVCDVVGWVSEPATKEIFSLAGFDFQQMFREAGQRGFRGAPLNIKVSTSMEVKIRYDISYNAVAKINGSGKPDEYVIYTAHWDHVGIGRPDEKGDTIYNGAVDNASGTAGLLQIAKAFQEMKTRPERSIIFLAFTAEEQGLVGSEYYTTHPVYPLSQTVANINLDALLSTTRMKDLIIVGRGQSDLEDYVQQEAKRVNRYISPEPEPGAGYYFRSDHYNFAKMGVPALFISSGIDEAVGGKEAGLALKKEYHQNHYHRPSDEFNPSWNLEGALDDLKLLFNVGKRVALEKTWPAWKAGSEFESLRKSK